MSFIQSLRPTVFQSIARSAAPRAAFSTTPRASLARYTIIGRLGAEPEVLPTSTGKEVIKMTIASNSGPRDNPTTSWFKVSSFEADGPRKDLLKGLQKGTLLYSEGDASFRQIEDKETGSRNILNFTQRNFEILKRPYDGESSSSER
ncbi:MAG: hypothetical protein M1825_000987 [Sarcosagium campestre]|nr:MAG: hypothetical protein M1825_000987 [Sarcosagium campestre]